ALIQHPLIVGGVAARCALDGRLDLILRHVDRARVLDHAAQRRVRSRIRSRGLHGNGDVLRDAGELLRHAVPPREHRVLSDFENASHGPNGALGDLAAPSAAPPEPACYSRGVALGQIAMPNAVWFRSTAEPLGGTGSHAFSPRAERITR